MVTQIPALITSTAAGIIVTRATSDGNMGSDINQQLTGRPQAGLISGTMLLFMGLIPGLPTWPFAAIGSLLVGVSLLVRKRKQDQKALEAEAKRSQTDRGTPRRLSARRSIGSAGGISACAPRRCKSGGDLIERIVQIRKVAAMDMGYVAPPVRVRDSTDCRLLPTRYT